MPLFLDEGEIVTVPPPGKVALTATTAGAVQRTKSDGTTETIGGGSVVDEDVDWFAYWKTWAQTIIPTLVASTLESECQESSALTLSATGTASAAVHAAQNGGVLQLNTGATAGSLGKAINLSGTTKALVTNARTQKYALIGRIKVATNPAGTGVCTLLNMTDEVSADAQICVRGATPTVYSTIVGGATASTGIAHGNTYAVLAQLADGTDIKWYMNQTLIATVAQSGSANAAGHLQMLASNGDQSANTEAHIDKLLVLTENP